MESIIDRKTFLDYPSLLDQLNKWKDNGFNPFHHCQIVYVPAKVSHMHDTRDIFYDKVMDTSITRSKISDTVNPLDINHY